MHILKRIISTGILLLGLPAVALGANPTIILTPSTDSGLSTTDNITNEKRPAFEGKANNSVSVFVKANGSPICTAKASKTGNWSCKSTIDLPDNIYVVRADTVTSGSSKTTVVTIDTQNGTSAGAPDLLPLSDTGISNTDNVTNATLLLFTGLAEPFAKISLRSNGFPICTVQIQNTNTWSCSKQFAGPGVYKLDVAEIDRAGNSALNSPSITVTIVGNIPEGSPWTPDLMAKSDTGLSQSDNTTTDTTPSFTGKGQPGQTVRIFTNSQTLCIDMVAQSGWWECASKALIDGTYGVRSQYVVDGGFGGAPSDTTTVIIDTKNTQPANIPDLLVKSDTGVSSTDNITNTTVLELVGFAEPFARITLIANNFGVYTTNTPSTGKWAFRYTAATHGTYRFRILEVDVAGNKALTSPNLTVTIVTPTPPVTPPVTLPTTPTVPDTTPTTESETPTTGPETPTMVTETPTEPESLPE